MAVIAQMFEDGAEPGERRPVRDREAELARLRLLISETGTVPARFAGRAADRGGASGAAAASVAGAPVAGAPVGAVPATGASPSGASPTAAADNAVPSAAPSTWLTPAQDDTDDVPVLPGLRPLLPNGVLLRGSVVAVEDRVRPWTEAPSYLALALAAGATADGAWCGVVGLPAFGIAAAAGLGADLKRMLMLDEPGDRWAEAVAVLAGAVDLILVRPPGRPTAEHVRRITARLRKTARQRGAALIVAGSWTGAGLTLRTTNTRWSGLGEGTGHLTGRRVTVAAEGRGIGRPREADLWLPAADGTVRPAEPVARDGRVRPSAAVTATIREGGEVIPLRSA